MMTISNINPILAPVGQWVYIQGSGFDLSNTNVYFGTTECSLYVVESENQIVAQVPVMSLTSCYVKLINGPDEVTSSQEMFIQTISLSPIIDTVSINNDTRWLSIIGSNFVWNETTISYNGKNDLLFVDSPNVCGIRLDVNETVTSFQVTTPNGTVGYSL